MIYSNLTKIRSILYKYIYSHDFCQYQLSGVQSIRPAIHGDTVQVEILPYEQWLTDLTGDLMVISKNEELTETEEIDEMDNLTYKSTEKTRCRLITGYVRGIVKTGKREFVCSVSEASSAMYKQVNRI